MLVHLLIVDRFASALQKVAFDTPEIISLLRQLHQCITVLRERQ